MNLEEIEKLTDEEANLKVAGLVGYDRVPSDPEFGVLRNGHALYRCHPHAEAVAMMCPKYSTDLNACAKMEDSIKDYLLAEHYTQNLNAIVNRTDRATAFMVLEVFAIARAKPRQRVNAFLAVMGGGE